MRSSMPRKKDRGPFLAEQIRSGDPYELSRGHPIHCLPTGGSGSGPNGLGFSVVAWDPAVTEAGVDAGYAPEPDMLRAPDVAVGNVPSKPGWIPGAPRLAIEYADIGQDEEKLQEKIADLLAAGTEYLWVVRLTGPRRVEVHTQGEPPETMLPGQLLRAPGVLQNPLPVEALYDRSAAEQVTFTNLLQRRGYADLETVLRKGREEGREQGRLDHARSALRRVLARRGLTLAAEHEARIAACQDLDMLDRWLDQALSVESAGEIFDATR
jgi:Uma2 family endonuclease